MYFKCKGINVKIITASKIVERNLKYEENIFFYHTMPKKPRLYMFILYLLV